MKRRRFLEITLMVLLAGLSSCSEGPLDSPEPLLPENNALITLDCSSFYRYAEGGDVEVYVKADEGASYKVSIPSDVSSWVSTSTTQGTGNEYVTFSVKPNDTGNLRSASITFQYGVDRKRFLKINQSADKVSDLYGAWGIPGEVIASVSNDRPYDWYIDQGDTGLFSDINCGPSSATMATKWYDKDYHGTVLDARNLYKPTGGWWNTDEDLMPFFSVNKVPIRIVKFINDYSVKDILDKGSIAVICLDMNILSYQAGETNRVNRFYTTSPKWGHFIVIMGYVQTEEDIYYQCYDPFTMSKLYPDATPKGRGRYYKASELRRSVTEWHPSVYVIDAPSS